MTSLAIASDSLDALKSRKDESARARLHESPELERQRAVERESSALRAFSAWFRKQHADGGVAVPAEGVLNVLPGLSKSFCVGMYDLRYFIGIPREFMNWFQDLPWAHLEVAPGISRISLLCRPSKVTGATLTSFALNFDVQPAGYTQALLHYHFLDVRAIDPMPAQGGTFRLSREVYLTLPVRIGVAPRTGIAAS